MEKIRLITWENVPCWYELSFREKGPAIILRIHQDFAKAFPSINNEAPIVLGLQERFNFKTFNGSFDKDFGFDGVFAREENQGEFLQFAVKIPRVRKLKGVCPRCGGSGEDKSLNGRCLYCDGEGKEYFYDWEKLYAISASFTVVLGFLLHPKIETSCSLPQLMTVQTVTLKDMHGGSLDGDYSISLCRWMDRLYKTGNSEIVEMTEAMKSAYGKMDGGLRSFYFSSFWARVAYEGGWLNVTCPGDACGLHPASTSVDRSGERGYEFSCHNVDDSMQQITLLAGLAVLHDKARKEIKV